jgi:hypothetical protein
VWRACGNVGKIEARVKIHKQLLSFDFLFFAITPREQKGKSTGEERKINKNQSVMTEGESAKKGIRPKGGKSSTEIEIIVACEK